MTMQQQIKNWQEAIANGWHNDGNNQPVEKIELPIDDGHKVATLQSSIKNSSSHKGDKNGNNQLEGTRTAMRTGGTTSKLVVAKW